MNVTMLVLNNFAHDARVHKEAKSLAADGHDVQVIALRKPGLATQEQVDGYHVRRLVLKSRRWRGDRAPWTLAGDRAGGAEVCGRALRHQEVESAAGGDL